ncbi:MAG: sugar phosphate isomerase/epimerase, partial [Gemmataceae bacterium]|nr:sugar phosphate isomerase/epimerase [Gemmataceae bacterium]
MQPAVTVTLVPEMRQGPFVFSGDLADGCRRAAAYGFAAIELFPPDPDAVATESLQRLLEEHGLTLAAVGTGAGWFRQQLSLTSPDESVRTKALDFAHRMMQFAAAFAAPIVIGALQGQASGGVSQPTALRYLGHALFHLDEWAEELGVTVLYEPLNRYESNLIHTLADAALFIRAAGLRHVRLLADLFHMNIEEQFLAGAIRQAGSLIGHVHFSDSNRRAAGLGHTNFAPIIEALRAVGYTGYLSAEVLPIPDADTAARQAI